MKPINLSPIDNLMQRDSARRLLQRRPCPRNILQYLITELCDSVRRCLELRFTVARHGKTFGLFLPTAVWI
jgi:hypothetical protein